MQEKILGELIFARIHVGPVLALARIQENIPEGSLSAYSPNSWGNSSLSFHSLIFLFYQGKTSDLPRIFSHCRTPKILGKDRENTKITKEIPCLKLTKEIQKNQGMEGQGFGCEYMSRLYLHPCEYRKIFLANYFRRKPKGDGGKGTGKKCHDNLRQTSRQFTTWSRQLATFHDNFRLFVP